MYDLNFREENRISGEEDSSVSELVCKTLFAWEEAVSPHLAAERESGGIVGDSKVIETLGKCLRDGLESESESERGKMEILCIVETAGGVASPGPSGSLQCDLYRPFRLPSILVGDGRLGGISGTISAYESLKLRGYDVVAVVFEDHGLANEVPLMSYLRNRVPVLVLPPLPQDSSNDLMEWFDESHNVFDSLKNIMLLAYSERIQRLCDMPKRAGELFWWPFTQHKLVPEEAVTVIDSRCGENFSVYQDQKNKFIGQQFDACASWWTQGPDATLQIELARDMGYTAARFGHVMFPENVYEPALECAELLLQGVGKGWASRAYFSDNGSTAIEIALKMAFRKFSFDHEVLVDFLGKDTTEKCIELKVLALKGSYHGDTLGAMEAQAPSPYTGFLQQPWYSGRGLFLDPPTVFMYNSKWILSLPEWLYSKIVEHKDITFCSRDEIFYEERDSSDLASIYSSYISQNLLQNPGLKVSGCIGALIIEPVVHAAGGMHMVDPLFQRILVKECQNRKIPVIFDEVFTGFWRLGVETTADLLGCVPDIACYGKLLTGGVIPLAATLATNAVFDSFVGDSKLKALLHGHSYSAHALGCAAAAKSIKWFKDPQTNHNIIPERRLLRELWDLELIQQISSHRTVQRVVALGTLCAIELQAAGCNAGYGSLYAASLLKKLREDGVYMRPLGNVIYLMCGPCSSPEVCSQLLLKLYQRLEEFDKVEEKLKSC
ncbi:Bifunctional dethiobiotin synthetase/7,8-diamino-pelargonic acid aminotransferase [Citrus sinensis]|nr:Bifunctional dethiobiotin synthetase/7,8-diamino-pelargonic acid aminotransferase [Citrus sinensis]